MTTQKQNSKEYFKSIMIIYLGLLIGPISFAILTLYLNIGLHFSQDDSLRDIFLIIVPILVVNGFITGHLIYKSRLKKIMSYNSLSSKMGEYRGAMIIRLAMLEGASLFAIIAYLITADFIFIGITGLIVVYFIMLKPTADKISLDLELNPSEKSKIENPNEIIAEIEIN